MTNSSFWNNMVGVHVSYSAKGTFSGFFIGAGMAPASTIIDDATWVGWEGWHPSAPGMAVEDTLVQGYPVGLLLRDATFTELSDVSYSRVQIPVGYNRDRSLRM
jgi:hypothetical protein